MKTLYLGLEFSHKYQTELIVHCPFISIVPKPKSDPLIIQAFQKFSVYTHMIFTSRNAVSIFFDLADAFAIDRKMILNKTMISVGQRTAEKLKEYSIVSDFIATQETAEGIIDVLRCLDRKKAHFFLPQSAIARMVIPDWLTKQQIDHTACPIYDTLPNLPDPLPDLNEFNKIIFTSPSVVRSFIQAYGSLPTAKTLICKGPITQRCLDSFVRHLA